MAKKETGIPEEAEVMEEAAEQVASEEQDNTPEAASDAAAAANEALAKEHEQYLRLAAEYDNFRKRSQKEKDGIYTTAKADTIAKFLPVFDNLERAAQQPSTDEAYKKGVEMTLSGLREVMKNLGVEEFGAVGDPFDPNRHNAVMHIESEDFGESVLAQVFQKGFIVGDKVIRFAMVQVAN